jgi:hypothetical protein
MFDRDEIVQALRERGFGDVRQRISGLTQFVGGRLPASDVKMRGNLPGATPRRPEKPANCGEKKPHFR